MPVFLPEKEIKTHKSHHDRTSSLPVDPSQTVLARDDAERALRRELVSFVDQFNHLRVTYTQPAAYRQSFQ